MCGPFRVNPAVFLHDCRVGSDAKLLVGPAE